MSGDDAVVGERVPAPVLVAGGAERPSGATVAELGLMAGSLTGNLPNGADGGLAATVKA